MSFEYKYYYLQLHSCIRFIMAQNLSTSRKNSLFLRKRPFLDFFSDVLTTHFGNNLAKIRILEVGAGSGELMTLLKEEFPSLNIVGLDLNQESLKAIPDMEGVTLKNVGFMDFQDEEKFDVVLFTKSLRYIFPLEKTVLHAYELLKRKGLLVAEEFSRDLDSQSLRWFTDRLELIAATEVVPTRFEKLFDSSIPPSDRWDFICPPLPLKKDLIEAVTSHFELENTRVVDTIPFLFNMFATSGLENIPDSEKIFSTFLRQEEVAIKEGKIMAMGLYIVAGKSV